MSCFGDKVEKFRQVPDPSKFLNGVESHLSGYVEHEIYRQN